MYSRAALVVLIFFLALVATLVSIWSVNETRIKRNKKLKWSPTARRKVVVETCGYFRGAGETAMRKIAASVLEAGPFRSALQASGFAHANCKIKAMYAQHHIYRRYAKLIRGAQHTVLLSTYHWHFKKSEESQAANLIGAGLLAAQSMGKKLKVRILVARDWGKICGTDGFKFARKSIRLWEQRGLNLRHHDIVVACRERSWTSSFHSKFLVVDGRTCCITGSNVQNNNDDVKDAWFDAMCETESESLARAMEDYFFQHWKQAVCSYRARPSSDPAVRARKSRFFPSDPPACPEKGRGFKLKPALACFKKSGGGGGSNVLVLTQLASTWNWHRCFPSPVSEAYRAAISAARRSIDITTSNLNSLCVVESLIARCSRPDSSDFRVRVLMSTKFNRRGNGGLLGKILNLHGDNREVAHRLRQKCGANLSCRNLCHPLKTKQKRYPVAQTNHSKLMVIDREIAIVGSANLASISLTCADEVNWCVQDEWFARELTEKIFEPRWNASVEM